MLFLKKRINLILLGAFLIGGSLTNQAQAYYAVGEQLNQETLDRVVLYCANGGANTAFSQLLVPENGQGTRVLLLNFFASW